MANTLPKEEKYIHKYAPKKQEKEVQKIKKETRQGLKLCVWNDFVGDTFEAMALIN